MFRKISIAVVALAALSTASYGAGCQGQKGSVIFEDTFSDDTGGWAQPIDGVVPEYGPEPKVHLKAPNSGYVWYNNTFNASEGAGPFRSRPSLFEARVLALHPLSGFARYAEGEVPLHEANHCALCLSPHYRQQPL
jgi:hypothetical protein